VRLFLDTSVILAASGSSAGASRAIFTQAEASAWSLIASPYVLEEVARNVGDLGGDAVHQWSLLRPQLKVMDDVLTLDRPVQFEPAKDKPVLFAALAWADVLLTLDRGDFGPLMSQKFYGLLVLRPADWLRFVRGWSDRGTAPRSPPD